MATFRYRGRDKAGALVSGTMEASSAGAVASQLLGGKITPIAIDEAAASTAMVMPKWFQQKITIDEMAMFSRQMYSLVRAGVVLNRAVRGLADSVSNARFRAVLLDVEVGLNSGIELATSFSRHRDVFDNLFISIIRVGENSGRLDLAFKQMSEYLQLEKDTRRRIGSAVRYPLFVVIAISIAMVVLNIWVIPVFADLFSKFDAELPWATRILIATSSFFVEDWPWLVAGIVGIVAACRYYVNTVVGELHWHRMKLRIPLIGTILERAMLARYSRSFAMMLSSGVPLIQALELCAQAVGNSFMAQQIRGMCEGIQRGESLLRAAQTSDMFTPLVMQMIQVGEETGKVDEMLGEVALFYEEEVDYDLKNLASYIEPIMIAAIAGLVMILALGIFLPMWDMMNVMQR